MSQRACHLYLAVLNRINSKHAFLNMLIGPFVSTDHTRAKIINYFALNATLDS